MAVGREGGRRQRLGLLWGEGKGEGEEELEAAAPTVAAAWTFTSSAAGAGAGGAIAAGRLSSLGSLSSSPPRVSGSRVARLSSRPRVPAATTTVPTAAGDGATGVVRVGADARV